MSKIELSKTTYANATQFKYKNARVNVMSLPTEDYVIELKILSSKEEANIPRAIHKSLKDKIVVTGIRISKSAALSVLIGLQEQLKKDGVIGSF